MWIMEHTLRRSENIFQLWTRRLDVARITIGQDVQIGPNLQLLTPTHPIDADLKRAKYEAGKPIVIGDNVWLGDDQAQRKECSSPNE